MQDITEQQVGAEVVNEDIEAVYENGMFRPLTDIHEALVEGQRVKLSVRSVESVEDPLQLLQKIYEDLSDEEIDEIEQVMLDRSNWSTRRPEDLFSDALPDAS